MLEGRGGPLQDEQGATRACRRALTKDTQRTHPSRAVRRVVTQCVTPVSTQPIEALPEASPAEGALLLRHWTDGRVKLFVMRALLHARRRHATLFDVGEYRALEPTSEHVLAFARRHGTEVLICVASRLTGTLAGPGRFPVGSLWSGALVALPRWAHGSYTELFTGRVLEPARTAVPVPDALTILPVAVLLRDRG